MSEAVRPRETRMTICDLCDEEILDEGTPDTRGSLTAGYIAHKVEVPKTKWAWLNWPPHSFQRRKSWEEMQKPENRERRYDFHGQCIVDLVEGAIHDRATLAFTDAQTGENDG